MKSGTPTMAASCHADLSASQSRFGHTRPGSAAQRHYPASTLSAEQGSRGTRETSNYRHTVPPGAQPSIGNYGNSRDVVQAGTIHSVRTGSSGALVIAVGLVVVLASAATIISQAVAHRIGHENGTGGQPSAAAQS